MEDKTKQEPTSGQAQAPVSMMKQIMSTAPTKIPELGIVRQRFIENYQSCNGQRNSATAELQYNRQMIFFKQAIEANSALKNADPFSIYSCFALLAIKNWSLDPNDNQVYLVAKGGKAILWPQASAHIRRLIDTNQIKYAEQVRLVYRDDDFQVRNGRIIDHIEKFKSEEIVAGYIKFVLDDAGNEKHIIYRKSDWEAWRAKSPSKNDGNWCSGELKQPDPGFLRTKIAKHAATEKTWASGMAAIGVGQEDVIANAIITPEIEDDPELIAQINVQKNGPAKSETTYEQPSMANTAHIEDATVVDSDDFVPNTAASGVRTDSPMADNDDF